MIVERFDEDDDVDAKIGIRSPKRKNVLHSFQHGREIHAWLNLITSKEETLSIVFPMKNGKAQIHRRRNNFH